MPDQKLPAGEGFGSGRARLLCTTRDGGASTGAFASNNLALHVEDDPAVVQANRNALAAQPGLDALQWLNQVHGTHVHQVDARNRPDAAATLVPDADACWTSEPGVGLAILTADCLPVVLVDSAGQLVAAAHAGWRGLCAGVLENLVATLPVDPARLQAFIGPAISVDHFEVGAEVADAFATAALGAAVRPGARAGKFQADLVAASRLQLERLGVRRVLGGLWCTYADSRFYSWRRATHEARRTGVAPATGRQVSLIWLV